MAHTDGVQCFSRTCDTVVTNGLAMACANGHADQDAPSLSPSRLRGRYPRTWHHRHPDCEKACGTGARQDQATTHAFSACCSSLKTRMAWLAPLLATHFSNVTQKLGASPRPSFRIPSVIQEITSDWPVVSDRITLALRKSPLTAKLIATLLPRNCQMLASVLPNSCPSSCQTVGLRMWPRLHSRENVSGRVQGNMSKQNRTCLRNGFATWHMPLTRRLSKALD